jgi:hypothetical protein
MKNFFFALILTLAILSEIFSQRIWEKNLKNHIKTLRLKIKHDAKSTRKPSAKVAEHINVLELRKQYDEERRNRDERRGKFLKLTVGEKENKKRI